MDSSRGPRPGGGPPLAFDRTKFPSPPTRKALVVVDFQNDFVTSEGAVPMAAEAKPDAMVERTAQLVTAFRSVGDIIWVQSQFERKRNFIEGQQIITKKVAAPGSPARRPDQVVDGDAFLSSDAARCVVRRSTGWQLAGPLKKVLDPKRDVLLMKGNYSAFKDTKLLQILRPKFVTTLYLCGSLVNVGVHATAIDAVSHGLSIKLVSDCCGWTKEDRLSLATENLIEVSGCEVVEAQDMMEAIRSGRPLEAKPPSERERAASRIKKRMEDMEAAMKNLGIGVIDETGALEAGADDEDEEAEAEAEAEADGVDSLAVAAKPDRTKPRSSAKTADDVSDALQKLSISQKPARDDDSKSLPAAATASDDTQAGPGSTATPGPKAEAPTVAVEATGDLDGDAPIDPDSEDAGTLSKAEKGPDKDLKTPPDGDQPTASTEEPKAEPGGNDATQSIAKTSTSSPSPALPRTSVLISSKMKSEMADARTSTAEGSRDSDDDGSAKEATDNVKGVENVKDVDDAKDIGNDDKQDDDKNPEGPEESEPLCEGDTKIIYNILPKSLEEGAFDALRTEVDWQRMSHQGGDVPRLVAVQGDVAEDGSMPVYRHPADKSPPLKPFSPTVLKLKEEVENRLGHSLNHVLIQFYRDGKDYISEHSDKTLDIVRGTYIANLSLGAERTMVFRTKRADKDFTRTEQSRSSPSTSSSPPSTSPPPPPPSSSSPRPPSSSPPAPPPPGGSIPRQIQKAKLPHNSLCRMGLETNMRWLHAIKQDKRRDAEKTPAELAFAGGRISLTFRSIGTFLNQDETSIWGQGATAKTKDGARPVVNGDDGLKERLVFAFGTENHAAEFDWEEHYGKGFDVLHMNRHR